MRLSKMLYLVVILFLFATISSVDSYAQEKQKKKQTSQQQKKKDTNTSGGTSLAPNVDNKNSSDFESTNNKPKKNKKKKSTEKLLMLLIGSAVFSQIGDAQVISAHDISKTIGISTTYVNAAIRDAHNAGAIVPMVYEDKYYVSTNDLRNLMDYLSTYLQDNE